MASGTLSYFGGSLPCFTYTLCVAARFLGYNGVRQALGHVGTRFRGLSKLRIISLSLSLSIRFVGDELKEFKVENV